MNRIFDPFLKLPVTDSTLRTVKKRPDEYGTCVVFQDVLSSNWVRKERLTFDSNPVAVSFHRRFTVVSPSSPDWFTSAADQRKDCQQNQYSDRIMLIFKGDWNFIETLPWGEQKLYFKQANFHQKNSEYYELNLNRHQTSNLTTFNCDDTSSSHL